MELNDILFVCVDYDGDEDNEVLYTYKNTININELVLRFSPQEMYSFYLFSFHADCV